MASISPEELAKHKSKDDVWIAIHGNVYDLTKFASSHPGGASILYKYGGTEATEEFDSLHSKSVLDTLSPEMLKGKYGGAPKAATKAAGPAPVHAPIATSDVPIHQIINVRDFLPLAEKNMPPHGWIYYSTAAEDEETYRENENVFLRYLFRPRVCVDVSRIDTRTTILGFPSSLPLFICGAALVGLAHPEGEVGVCKAAHTEGVIQMAPCFSSKSLEEIAAARAPGQPLFYQLYINSDRAATERVLKKVEALGFQAVFITVDAPKLGRREKDMRHKFQGQLPALHTQDDTNRNSGIAMALNSFIAANVTWKDITWVKSLVPKMKIVLKGVQRGDDAIKAVEYGCDGILLSNHGGRQMDTARSGLEVLVEVAAALRGRGLFDKVELYVDGGIRRGNDIAKCLALGARAVGVGRPVVFGLAAYGQKGAEKALQIFKAELQNTMGLLGATTVSEITPDMVIERAGNTPIPIQSRL
jgi:L-lactate dehydrogenase (cytochrome)